MTWLPRDCHAHTTMSDGVLSVAELVEVVTARGVRPSVSDHLSRDVARSITSVDAIAGYLDALERHPVARGGEFCWHDALWREVPDDLIARFTHWIGSMHGILLDDGTLVHAWQPELPTGLDARGYMEALIDNIERMAYEMPVDILAHPTLVHLSMRHLPGEELWTEEDEERLVEALYRGGIAFELSSRYWPHERLVRRVRARGVRFSLGSDGHTREQVGNIEGPLALGRALGIRDGDFYDPFVHGSRARRHRAVTRSA